MAIKAVSQLPDPIQPLADGDLLFLTQYDAENDQYVSVQLPLGDLKEYVSGGPPPIGCAGATSLIRFNTYVSNNTADIDHSDDLWFRLFDAVSNELLFEYNMHYYAPELPSELIEGVNQLGILDFHYDSGEFIPAYQLSNISESYQRLKLVIMTGYEGSVTDLHENPTIDVVQQPTLNTYEIAFCLAPA